MKKTNRQVIIDGDNVVSIVKKRYCAIPHKLVYDTAMTIVNERNIQVVERFTASTNDNNAFVMTLLDKTNYFDFDKDRYRLGITLCNSYDYSLSLSASLYLHREICSNGLFMPIKINVPNIRLKHIGDADKLIMRYIDGIHQLIDRRDVVLQFLQKMYEMQLTPKLVTIMMKYMPLQVLLKYAIIQGNDENDIIVKRNTNVLDVLNEYTYHFTHRQKMNSAVAYNIQRQLVGRLMKEATSN